jgi:hypothetical protein
MKNFFLILSIITIHLHSFTQIGISKTLENNVTKNQQQKEVDDYNQQYTFYLKKANRQKILSTTLLVTSTLLTTTILTGIDGLNYNRGQMVGLTNVFFVGLSTTFLIQSNKNRKKAYELKRKSYL